MSIMNFFVNGLNRIGVKQIHITITEFRKKKKNERFTKFKYELCEKQVSVRVQLPKDVEMSFEVKYMFTKKKIA